MMPNWVYRLLFFTAFQCHLAMALLVERFNTPAILGLFGLLWLVFLIQWADQKIDAKRLIVYGMILRGAYLLVFPELSDDFWRYLWDGMVLNEGVSPYEILPSQLDISQSIRGLLPVLNSPEYFSIYPPVLQGLFSISARVAEGNPFAFVLAMRALVLLAELGSMLLIWKLLKAWNLHARNLMLYAFNPLVIVEFTGNLHPEAFMVFFLLLSLWLLVEKRQALSAVAFGLSVGTKLFPLMFLPFFIKRIGWVKTAVFSLVFGLIMVLMYAPFWSAELVQNTRETLALYFSYFEFNGSVYYLVREVGFWVKGYNIIADTAIWLPRIVLVLILLIAFLNKDRKLSSLPKMMLFAWFIYYAFATTVNPWYVAVLAAFLPFVKYRFGLIWLMLVPLSYHAFGYADYHESLLVIAIEYVPVYLWLFFELGLFKSLEKNWALRRAEVKRKRLLPFLSSGQSVLEVGAGNEALTKLLGLDGLEMVPLDIADKSLFNEMNVTVYDGKNFPFYDKQFDTCQLITILHHTTNAEELISEAKRVSNRIIIMEDIYESPFQKYLTWCADSLVNWEFYGHPHTNRTDVEWKEVFQRNGLELENVEYYRFLLFFKQVTYVLTHVEKREK
ncbi:MAG: alpha-1,6-mannosyltransferase [Bacteroidia bacterium]|jgi:alpha-1,6-mannosyltransferase